MEEAQKAENDRVQEPEIATNGPMNPKSQSNGSDPDAQDLVISSLRSQIQDLYSQVTQLNNKLVQSYDRVSDLEDDLHVTSSNLRSSSVKISQLELERTQHLSALNTGLLVEKSHVTAELNRLMERATEEAAQRGQAETARQDIEKDLDDLSATLFGQANTMVAEARYARFLSERKVEEAELALKGAEEAVAMMQKQMQDLETEKEQAEKNAQSMQVIMGKGKWVDKHGGSGDNITRSIRLLSSHLPYQEFLLFVAHLRSVHPASPQPPAMSTLLPLPFLARLLTEDSEPTVRLDLAPSLNWLSRRSVLSAIHNGQLTIEPMSSSALLQESTYSTTTSIPGLNSSSNNIGCALCGTPIFPPPEGTHMYTSPPPTHPMSHQNSNSWSTTLFKRPLAYTSNSTTSTRSNSSYTAPLPAQVHIFRVSSPTPPQMTSTPSSTLPSGAPSYATSSKSSQYIPQLHSVQQQTASATIYPLCTNGWCLTRLRVTCSLWAFVRSGIVDKVWEEEVPALPPIAAPTPVNGEKPPVPPRRRGLWSMASALGEKAASWSEGDKDKSKKAAKEKTLPPPPPPVHPAVAAAKDPTHVPPPLPKRSEGRGRRAPDAPPTPAVEIDQPILSAEPEPIPQPQSPTHIPLPESRPATPAPMTAPSRTASPAPGVVGASTAAPPPLPRRAAARVPRPMSGLVSSRPATPAGPASPGGEVKANPIAAEEVAPSPIENKVVEGAAAVEGEPSAPPSTDSGGVTVTDEPTTNGSAIVDNVKKDEVAFVDDSVQITLSQSTVDGSDNEKFYEADGGDTADKTDPSSDRVVAGANGDRKADEEDKADDDDKEVYIGDATWEERTWKELVRLKEEMFWARVGGLR